MCFKRLFLYFGLKILKIPYHAFEILIPYSRPSRIDEMNLDDFLARVRLLVFADLNSNNLE